MWDQNKTYSRSSKNKVEKFIRKGKKKSQSKKDQPKKTSGARQVQSRGGQNRVSSCTFHYRT